MTAIERAFVAVVPPPAVLDAVEELVAPHRIAEPRLRWCRREQLHVTLQFLGRVGDAEGLVAALATSLRLCAPVRGSQVGTAGAFPSPTRSSVVWLGLGTGAEGLRTLAAATAAGATQTGWVGERRPFHAHLTVARVPRPRNLTRLVTALDRPAIGPPWDVAEVVLFASDTRPDGAVHTEVERFALRA